MPSNETLAPTPVSQWKKAPGAQPVDVALPSGNTARIKQIPMPDLLAGGIFPDTLQGYVQKALKEESAKPQDHKGKKGKKQDEVIGKAEMAEMMKDPQKIADMFSVFDKVTVMAVVEPKVLPTPEDEADRDPEKLYVDEVDTNDKAFIFQFCVGGSKDQERFRTESASVMGSLADLQELPSSTQ
jgi:hypothetical protein